MRNVFFVQSIHDALNLSHFYFIINTSIVEISIEDGENHMTIFKELIANLSILTSLLFLYTQITKSSPLTQGSNITKKIKVGIIGGILSNILMQYSMPFGETIIDLRHIPIILLAYYGGALPSLITMIMIILGRFIIGINSSSYIAFLIILSITLISIYLAKKNLSRKVTIFLMLTFSNVIFAVFIIYLIKDIKVLLFLIPIYWVISYLAGIISFYIVEYLRGTQNLFEKYKSESSTDGLTGLNNVRKFDQLFNDLLKNVEAKNEKLSLLYIDIDFFKKVNDTYGHQEGDVVLKALGEILKSSVRSFDIVSRNGGEEFTVILLDCSLDRSVEISEKIRMNVEEYKFKLNSSQHINITVSIGLATYSETTNQLSRLIEDADKALYHAKRNGRNKVSVANTI